MNRRAALKLSVLSAGGLSLSAGSLSLAARGLAQARPEPVSSSLNNLALRSAVSALTRAHFRPSRRRPQPSPPVLELAGRAPIVAPRDDPLR